MVDAPVSKTGSAWSVGSSPTLGTRLNRNKRIYKMHGSYNDAREKFQVKKKDSSIRKAHQNFYKMEAPCFSYGEEIL